MLAGGGGVVIHSHRHVVLTAVAVARSTAAWGAAVASPATIPAPAERGDAHAPAALSRARS